MKKQNITHSQSIKDNLEGWCFEVGSEYEAYSQKSARYFIKHIGKASVVDLGSGDGAATKVFVENGNPTTAVDINPVKLERVRGAEKIEQDFITFLSKPVDNIFMHHALEHFVGAEEVLSLISKHLKPGCYCYISVPKNDKPHSVHHVAFDSPDELCPEGLQVIDKGSRFVGWDEFYALTYRRHRMADTPHAPEILEEGAKILAATGYKWWVECGTLLGMYREGKLLDHDDPDIDVSIEGRIDDGGLIEKFKQRGFELFAHGSHQIVFKKRDVLFDIARHHREGDKLVMDVRGAGKAIQEYRLFENLGEIEFNGHKYPCPSPIEDYLVARYGDWKTPKTKKNPWTEPGETLVWKSES